MKKIKFILLVVALFVSTVSLNANQLDLKSTVKISFVQKPVTFLSNVMAKAKFDKQVNNIDSVVTPFIGRIGDIDNRSPGNFDNPFTVKLLVAASILLSVGLTLFVGGLAGFIVGFFMEEIAKIVFLSTFGAACMLPGVVISCTSSVCFYKSWSLNKWGKTVGGGRR